jgi:hypothetical protein
MKIVVFLATLALMATGSAPVAAGPTDGFSSDNIEFVKQVPLEGTAAAARVLDDRLYLTTYRSFSIYDISDPLDPVELSSNPLSIQASNEDVDTNGTIMLISAEVPIGRLHIWDVEDATNPTEIAVLDGAGEHTTTCILDCKLAYGARGSVIDLSVPSAPKVIGNWMSGLPDLNGNNVHDVTEVRPGIVLTSSNPMMLLDARKDPVRPQVLAVGTGALHGLYHSNLWPQRGRDRFSLLSTEGGTMSGICDTTSGSFSVWDMKRRRQTRSFQLVDSFAMDNGTHIDGKAAPGLGCSAHWFDAHPRFSNGGLVVMAGYAHGARLLEVSPTGKISEVGHFMGHAAETWVTLWADPEVIYSIDFKRGLDILRYTG